MLVIEGLPARKIDLIWSHNLDTFIEHHVGRPWNLQQNDYSAQDTLKSFDVYPDAEASVSVRRWLATPYPEVHFPGRFETEHITTDEILNHLCNLGVLPEGTYYVHVWW